MNLFTAESLYSESFLLDEAGVDYGLKILDENIDEHKLSHDNKLSLLQVVKNILINWLDFYPDRKIVSLTVLMFLGKYRINISLEGEAHNPLLDTTGFGLPLDIHGNGASRDWELTPSYAYKEGVNTISIILPYVFRDIFQEKTLSAYFSGGWSLIGKTLTDLAVSCRKNYQHLLALFSLFIILTVVGYRMPAPWDNYGEVTALYTCDRGPKNYAFIDKNGNRFMTLSNSYELLGTDESVFDNLNSYSYKDVSVIGDKTYVLKSFISKGLMTKEQTIEAFDPFCYFLASVYKEKYDALNVNFLHPIVALAKGPNQELRFIYYNYQGRQIELYQINGKNKQLMWSSAYRGETPLYARYNAKGNYIVLRDLIGNAYKCEPTKASLRLPIQGAVDYIDIYNNEIVYSSIGSETVYRYGPEPSILFKVPSGIGRVIASSLGDKIYFNSKDSGSFYWDGDKIVKDPGFFFSTFLRIIVLLCYLSALYLLIYGICFFYRTFGFSTFMKGLYTYVVPLCLIFTIGFISFKYIDRDIQKAIAVEKARLDTTDFIPLKNNRFDRLGNIVQRFNEIKEPLNLPVVLNKDIPVDELELSEENKEIISDIRSVCGYLERRYLKNLAVDQDTFMPYLFSNKDGKSTVLYAADRSSTMFEVYDNRKKDIDLNQIYSGEYNDLDGIGYYVAKGFGTADGKGCSAFIYSYSNKKLFVERELRFIFTIVVVIALFGALLYTAIQEIIQSYKNLELYHNRDKSSTLIKEFYFSRQLNLFNSILASADTILLILLLKKILGSVSVANMVFYISLFVSLKGYMSMAGDYIFNFARKKCPASRIALIANIGILGSYIGVLCFIQAGNSWGIIIFRCFVALFCSIIAQIISYIPVFVDNDKASATAISNTVQGRITASIIGPVFLGLIDEVYGYAGMYGTLIALSFMALLLGQAAFTKNFYYVENSPEKIKTTFKTITKFFLSPAILILIVFIAFPISLCSNYKNMIFPVLAGSIGISDFYINNIVVVCNVIAKWMARLVGLIGKHISLWERSILGVALCGIGYTAMYYNTKPIYIIIMLVLIVFAAKFYAAGRLMMIYRMLRNRNLNIISYINVFTLLSTFVTSVSATLIGNSIKISYNNTFMLLGCICFFSVVLALLSFRIIKEEDI